MASSNVLSRPMPDATVPRNAFDRSFTSAYSSAVGQLLPVFCQPVIAGSHSTINRRIFQRTANVHTAAFATLDTHIQFYFVPMRQLVSTWDDFKLNIQDVNSTAYCRAANGTPFVGGVPYFNLSEISDFAYSTSAVDAAGYRIEYGAYRLLDMLGYGNYGNGNTPPNMQVNALRLLAYHKVYFDHFRNTAYEDNDPFYYNADWALLNNSGLIDGITSNNVGVQLRKLLTIHYVNYRKDYFQNLYPSLNYVQSVPTGVSWSVPKSVVDDYHNDTTPLDFNTTLSGETGNDIGKWVKSTDGSKVPQVTSFGANDGQLYLNGSQGNFSISGNSLIQHSHSFDTNANFSIPTNFVVATMSAQTIRATFALDKLTRASAYAPKHAKDQYEARYGIKFPSNPNQSTFIGSFKNDVVIGEVVNQTASESSNANLQLGAIGGKGVGASNFDNDLTFNNNEDGFIIGVQYSLPRTSYNSHRIDAYNLKSVREDFFIPEFMDMGLQPLTRMELRLTDDTTKNNIILGYMPRYSEYKIGIDENHGVFSWDSDMQKFVVDSSSKLDGLFETYSSAGVSLAYFKVTPSDVDQIFQVAFDGTQSTDQFLNYTHFKFDCVMNMSVHGQPHL